MGKKNEHDSVAGADPTEYNVEAIAELERRALHERTTGERFSDAVTAFMGSMAFVVIHVLLFIGWFSINLGAVPFIPIFDPFPFGILTLIVSAEGVFLAIFILISQNRMTRQADRRAHLDLQVNLLAERELTMILRMQERMCSHIGVPVEPIKSEAAQLMEETDVQKLVEEIEEKLPSE